MNTLNDNQLKNRIITIFWGMLILLVGGGLLASISYGAEMIAPAILFPIALCLIVFAIWSEKNWLAIIPGGIVASVGLVVLLETLMPDSEWGGQAMMFLFALSFAVYALRSKKNWWAIIPGGIFATIGLVVMLEILIPQQEFPILPSRLHWGVYSWVMFLGFAATFGITWLLRKSQPTGWAVYPAIGLLALAVAVFLLGSRFQEVWPVTMLLVIAGTLLLALLTRKRLPVKRQALHLNS